MKRRSALMLSITVALALCAACGWWLHNERQHYVLNRQLIATLAKGDTRTALALVNAGADPNTRYDPPPTPSLRLLLNQWLHRTIPPVNDSPTALMIAYTEGWDPTLPLSVRLDVLPEDLPLLRAMLAHGANVNARDGGHRTALHLALLTERLNTVELLLQHGADVNAQDKWRHPTIAYATRKDIVEATHLLLSHGANPNLQDVNGNAWLYYALFQHYPPSVIPELLEHGADPNLPNKQALTPFMLAKQAKHLDIVRLLQQHGAK